MIKKIDFKFIIILFLSVFTLVFVYNDDFLYKKNIVKIKSITIQNIEEYQNYLGITEKHYNKKITGILTNGKNKGDELVFNYENTDSSVVTERYKIGDKVFVKNNEIEGLKRDFYVALLLLVFINLIYVIGRHKGILSIVSVILNFIIFYIGLKLYFSGVNILLLCIIESIVFSILSLSLSNGINKKTMSAVFSVIVSFLLLLFGLLIIVNTTNYSNINFNELKFLTVPPEDILLPELLIGTVGAVMDVAITIASSISELIERDNNISVSSLKKSSKQIGKDIMGTMSNVLFFTYLCGGLPMFVLAYRNGFSFFNYITSNISLELMRFLLGSIGIIVTIPIATFITIKVFKRGDFSE